MFFQSIISQVTTPQLNARRGVMDKEESRLYNFLKHYNLEQYYDGFVKLGVVKVAHLKDVDDHDLTEIGMQRPEKIRLKKKVEENFSTMGKFKVKATMITCSSVSCSYILLLEKNIW